MTRTQHITMPGWLRHLLLWGLVVIVAFMPLHAFLSTWGGTAIGPLWLWKSWKEIVLVVLTIPVLGWLATNKPALQELVRQPLVIAVVAYVLLSGIVTALFWRTNGADASLAGLAMNLRYLGLASLAYLLFRYGGLSDAWLRHGKRFVVCAGLFVAVLGILQVLVAPPNFLAMFGYEKGVTIAPYALIDDKPELLRSFATLRGPNDFGAFLILPIVLVVAYGRRLPLWVTTSLLALLGWALILSSSRSAWIGALVALGVYALFAAGRRLSMTHLVGALAATTLLFAGLFYTTTHVAILRQAVFHSSPGDSSLTEGSTDKHVAATVGGIERLLKAPFGCGVGCAGPASYYGAGGKISENYFVQIAEETGILGLMLFLYIVGYAGYRLAINRRQQRFSRTLFASLVGYIVIGMLLHVWSDDPLSITWWVLAGAVIGYNESTPWKKSKNSSRSKTSYSSSNSS